MNELLSAAALLVAPVAAAQPPTAITNVTVIDVVVGKAVPGQTVLIDGATIATVVPTASFKPAKEATAAAPRP